MSRAKLSRRTFLEATAAATLATQLPSLEAQSAAAEPEYPENGTLIPDEGWHLWLDHQAQWKDDTIYLPPDVDLAKLPVNAPTGGWQMLTPSAGKEVILPATVEQFYWGKFGERPYTPDEYRYAADDPVPQNGAYLGVSWWYRELEIPASMQDKRIFLHIRGAHLRAEVYLNEKLVGYSILEELPFETDLTGAAKPGGRNLLAIRITNPFGRYDWVDGLNTHWGAVKIYRSHGFGALDRGLTLSAHDAVRIKDLWVLNRPGDGGKSAVAHAELELPEGETLQSLLYEVIEPRTGKTLHKGSGTAQPMPVPSCPAREPHEAAAMPEFDRCITETPAEHRLPLVHAEHSFSCPSAQLWDLHQPKLYHLRVKATTTSGKTDTRTIAFGFRWFAPEGLGGNALFRLNGRRIKIYTAISWGYWGLNGMFPVPELAKKEVTQAQKLGLTCLNFHRNLAKEDVVRWHDRLGLLRYMEPGAGKMAIGKLPPDMKRNAQGVLYEKPLDVPDDFAKRYMLTKCVAMVKAYRSHPSVIEYCLQNEIGADLKNPDTIAVLEAMRAEDPSRCIVLNDGFVAPPRRAAQAWFAPWNPKIHRSDEEAWGGWWNQHQGAGDQWYDEFYRSPTEFTYRSPHRDVISEFGEMEGCATPDNHSLMVHQITETYRRYGGTSYDLADHEAILAGYDRFLDRWGFRKAFPVTERLWLDIGKKCYDTWQNYLENARISDELDFAAISGWESTAIENHSGIVDNLRNFKSDPGPIRGTLLPVRPVAKQRAICTTRGKAATFDLFLLNDTARPVAGTLRFTAVTPSGRLLELGSFPVPAQTPDQFSYLVKEGFVTPPLTEQGMYRFRFALSSSPASTQTKEIWVTGVPMVKRSRKVAVGVSGITPALRGQLEQLSNSFGVEVKDFRPGERYDVIVSSGLTAHGSAEQHAGDTTGLEARPAAQPATKTVPGRRPEPGEGATVTQPGQLEDGILEAVRDGTPLLAMPQADTLSEGVARALAGAGAFTYRGVVGDFRAPWMGNWYIVRWHALYEGMPVDQVMGIHYQAKGRQANGLLVDGPNVEIVAAYSRDHDRNVGAGTFTCRLGAGKVVYHRVPELQPVLQQRFLANAIGWLLA